MGYSDFVTDTISDLVLKSISKHTDKSTAKDLMSAARKFSASYIKNSQSPALLEVSKADAVTLYIADILINFESNEHVVCKNCLAKALLLDKRIFDIIVRMESDTGYLGEIWDRVGYQKQVAILEVIKAVRFYLEEEMASI
jgi:hypothetical protein